MSPCIRARSPSFPWNRVAVVLVLTWLAADALSAQGARARYVGGTLAGQPPVTQYKCGSHAANGGMLMSAGRGEVHIVREGRSRVVVTFEDIKTSGLEKEPATRFGRTFIEAYRKAKVSMK